MQTARLLAALLALCLQVLSQAPGVVIERNGKGVDADVLAKANALRSAGKLPLTIEVVKAQLATPKPGPIKLPPVADQPLVGREIAARARAAHLRFGWHYLCKNCDHWHTELAGAYAIAADAIATCHHCVEPSDNMREGFLIAVTSGNEVLPVTAILASSATMDAAVLRVDGKLSPLALNEAVAPGDAAYCFSAPLGNNGYFSDGIVNRFYWMGKPGQPGTPDAWKRLRLNVSTDWAPGSSGAAVLDVFGNAIGHVSTISPLSEGSRNRNNADDKPREAPKPDASAEKPRRQPRVDRFGGATLITLHDAIPARGVLSLIQSLPSAAAEKPANQ